MSAAIIRAHGARLITALWLTLISTTAALADASDDYVTCLIGRAAVTLHEGDRKDSGKALEAAHKRCKEPKGVSETELEGISDYANKIVEAMAWELSGR